jgi:hypothetical protein
MKWYDYWQTQFLGLLLVGAAPTGKLRGELRYIDL